MEFLKSIYEGLGIYGIIGIATILIIAIIRYTKTKKDDYYLDTIIMPLIKILSKIIRNDKKKQILNVIVEKYDNEDNKKLIDNLLNEINKVKNNNENIEILKKN